MPKGVIQCKKIIIPAKCFQSGGEKYFTVEYKKTISEIRSFQKQQFRIDTKCEKLYFSYLAYGKARGDVGEKKLEKFFKGQGYKIVYPERLSLEEQLNMLANCHYFASTAGSLSHNIIFLPEHANVVLIPRSFYLTGYQEMLNQVIDLNIYYVDASLSVLCQKKRPQSGPFYYYASENLRNYFGIKDPCSKRFYRKQLGDFKLYLSEAKGFDDLHNRFMPEYYEKQFAYCVEKLQSAYPIKNFTGKAYYKMRFKIPSWIKGVTKAVIKRIKRFLAKH